MQKYFFERFQMLTTSHKQPRLDCSFGLLRSACIYIQIHSFLCKAADYSEPSKLWHSLSCLRSTLVPSALATDWVVRSTMCPAIVLPQIRQPLQTMLIWNEFHRP